MKIAVEGCAHGELEIIYDTLQALEERENVEVDLLICCGDFQASRNMADLRCMAVPPKYYNICSFYKYYTGAKIAPVLTIFVGGNHEASNYLQELPYGGWVAHNIYYLGYAGVVNIGGLRIGGISGIYKEPDYLKGHFEKTPYDNSTKRSIYHVRNLEIFRLKQLSQSQPLDIFITHDWPAGIWNYGNSQQLLRFKPFFKDDIESGKLGCKPFEELFNYLQPKYWFAAHLHCKFAALIQHSEKKATRFLALDKCLPGRRFLQMIDIPHDVDKKIKVRYDLEWLTILTLTNEFLSVRNANTYMPGSNCMLRSNYTPTDDEKSLIFLKFSENLVIPDNFVPTAEGHNSQDSSSEHVGQPLPLVNTQTEELCNILEIDDPLVLLEAFSTNVSDLNYSMNEDEQSEAYKTFNAMSPTKLNFNLPQPKFDNEENAHLSNVTECMVSESVASDINDGASESSSLQTSGGDLPMHKKFKRRNASIYDTGET